MYTVEELKNLDYKDFRNMDQDQKKEVMKSMKTKIKRRLRGFEKNKITSTIALGNLKTATSEDKRLTPLNTAKKWVEKIDTTTNPYKQNKNFLLAKNFLNSQTSTVRGHEKWLRNEIKAVGHNEVLKNYTPTQLSKLFQLVDSIREKNPGRFTTKLDSNQVVSLIIEKTLNKLNVLTFSELRELISKFL